MTTKKHYRKTRIGDRTREASRVILEGHLGRNLTLHEVVHHKNHDIHDNRIRNLQVMGRGPHARLHLKGKEKSALHRARIAEGVRKYHQTQREMRRAA